MTDTHPAAAPATAQPLARYTTAETGEAYWFFDSLMVIRADQPGQPVIIEATVAPGGGAPLHVHADLDDSFYLVAGRLAMRHGRSPGSPATGVTARAGRHQRSRRRSSAAYWR